jgi:hypothetical protein
MLNVESDSDFVAQHQKESSNYVKFYRQFVEKYQEHRDYILIISPGQSKTEVRRPIQEVDKSTYSREWTAYLEGKENQISGTPLEMMGLDKGLCEALKALYVYSVEQLSNLSDLSIQKIMGGHDLRNKAKAFLQKNSAEVIDLKTRLEESKAQSAATENALKLEIAELHKKMDAILNKAQATPKASAKPKTSPKAKGKSSVAANDHSDRM